MSNMCQTHERVSGATEAMHSACLAHSRHSIKRFILLHRLVVRLYLALLMAIYTDAVCMFSHCRWHPWGPPAPCTHREVHTLTTCAIELCNLLLWCIQVWSWAELNAFPEYRSNPETCDPQTQKQPCRVPRTASMPLSPRGERGT